MIGVWFKRLRRLHYWNWEVLVEPRMCWMGLCWKRWPCAVEVFLRLIPMVPLRVYVQWHYLGGKE